jgi:hypothetical protein
MNAHPIERHFAKIGARAKLSAGGHRRFRIDGVSIDVGRDGDGEFFDVAVPRSSEIELAVLDVQPPQRHLLLMARDDDGKHKFLCGHDERHWFVAAVPEGRSASTVATAMEALKPDYVRWQQSRLRVKTGKRNRRRNEAFVRQGEWFFVPPPRGTRINESLILRNEPLRRGGGKPHIVDELVRDGGEAVYVSHQYPNGLTAREYQALISRRPELRNIGWVIQRRNPRVFVRGKVRHPDHKTVTLDSWRLVLMNTETQSAAMRHVAFID